MAVDQDLLDQVAASVADLYREVESALNKTIANRLRVDGIDESPYQLGKLDAIAKLRRSAQVIIASLQAARAGVVRQAIAQAYRSGYAGAQTDLPERYFPKSGIGQRAREATRAVPNAGVVENIAQALHRDLGKVEGNLLRNVLDSYRAVQAGAATRIVTGAETRRQAAQAVWQRLMDKGITSFTDVRGRRWKLSSYAEMITRTNAQRAAVQGQTDRLDQIGVNLVIVSNHGQECKLCRPYEGKILSLGGPTGDIEVEHGTRDGVMVKVHVVDTLDGARAHGLFHPNAILGDQGCRVLGEIENAARAWYEGPSVHLTTARGNRLTVSPNHPVLTSDGWLAAGRIREGMHVFSAPAAERVDRAPQSIEDLDNVPARFEKIFDALAAHGCRTSVTASGDDFHGDGRSYKGEVDVVWTERALLDVLQPLGVEQLGEGLLVGAGVELHALAGGRAHLACGHGVGGPVAGTLPDLDAVGLESAPQRRLADAELPGEILAGLSCEVALDEVVNVERDWYTGHAYDLQTSTGAYLTADIVVHNCRHSTSAYLPGVTRIPANTADPEGDKARQRQRALERKIRAAKEHEQGALTPEAKKDAARRVRAAQAALRDHLKANPKLKRLPYREQVGAGNIPKRGGPAGGPVGDLQPPVQQQLPLGRDGGRPPGGQPPTPTPKPPRWDPPPRLTPSAAQRMQDAMLKGKPWSRANREAIQEYTYGWARSINDALRNGTKADDTTRQFTRALADSMRPSGKATTLYRYVAPDAVGLDDLAHADQLVGKTLQDRGFMSTTTQPSGHTDADQQMAIAAMRQVRMEIDTPAGTPLAYVDSISLHPGQHEVIVMAGTRYKVVDVTTDGAQTVIRVQVVP